MAHATSRRQHPNAPLTVEGRRRMVGCVVDPGLDHRSEGSRSMPRRYVSGGSGLLPNESGTPGSTSRPRRLNRTPKHLRVEVLRLRRKRRWGADHISRSGWPRRPSRACSERCWGGSLGPG